MAPRDHGTPLADLAWIFLKLGVVSVGGPVAHIAIMRQEFVERRRWFTDPEFLDLVGATNLIPGPNSTELAIHIGRARAGWRGLLVAGACFIMPAVVIVSLLAAAYVRFGSLPDVLGFFRLITPVVVAIVAMAVWALGRSAIRSAVPAFIALAAAAAIVSGVDEILVLTMSGLLGMALTIRPPSRGAVLGAGILASVTRRQLFALGTAAIPAGGATLTTIGLVFLKAGALLFGSGYVLLAFLRADLVDRLGWLTERQLLDAVAIGQATPGPVFTTATFVGYVLAGPRGAAVATIAIFLPAFAYVAVSAPLLPRLRRSALTRGALDGVNAASLALLAVVLVNLAESALTDTSTIAIAAASLLALTVWRVSPAKVIGVSAAMGLLLRLIVR